MAYQHTPTRYRRELEHIISATCISPGRTQSYENDWGLSCSWCYWLAAAALPAAWVVLLVSGKCDGPLTTKYGIMCVHMFVYDQKQKYTLMATEPLVLY